MRCNAAEYQKKKADKTTRHMRNIWVPVYALSIVVLYACMYVGDVKSITVPLHLITTTISIAFLVALTITVLRIQRAKAYSDAAYREAYNADGTRKYY